MCILVRALRACEEYIAFASLSHLLEGHAVCLAGRKLRYNRMSTIVQSVVFPLSSLSLLLLLNTITI